MDIHSVEQAGGHPATRNSTVSRFDFLSVQYDDNDQGLRQPQG